MKKLKIAFDGPAASGKSAVSKETARRLSYLYIDTGAMYRAVTWLSLKKSADIADETAITKIAEMYPVSLIPADNRQGYKVIIDGSDITDEITSDEVNKYVSPVSQISPVRKILVKRQQELGKDGGVVMAGRDITTVVMPDAELKIYLDATIEERTKRRFLELKSLGGNPNENEVMENLRMRDRIDSGRADSPLMIADGATVIDTTGKSLNEIVDEIVKMAENYAK